VGELVAAAFLPHPPIVVPEVGKGETAKASITVQGMQGAAREVAQTNPEVVVIISPHATVFSDAVAVTVEERLSGSLASFGAPGVQFDYANHLPLTEGIIREAAEAGVTVAALDRDLARRLRASTSLDHGTMVPLYYLRQAGWQGALVSLGMGLLPLEELYAFGAALRGAIESSSVRAAVVGSGDLSHRLTPGAPAGYDEVAREFDVAVRERVAAHDVPGLLDLPGDLVERAGECGLRPLIMLLGVLDGLAVEPVVHSYEGPFGVGYLAVSYRVQGGAVQSLVPQLFDRRRQWLADIRKAESAPVRLARQSLETYVREGREMAVPVEVPPELRGRAGVFVSIKKHGQLRGCIGTTQPTTASIANEIIRNAVQAGMEDPRFDPVEEEELPDLVYSVDILMPPEKVESIHQLDPRRYGVIVRAGRRSGLLLPDLEGVDTAARQVEIACQKAGIPPGSHYEMERFEVIRYR